MYSEDFGKITDGVFSFAPKELESEGVKTLTNSAEEYARFGYLPVVRAEGEPSYEIKDGVIYLYESAGETDEISGDEFLCEFKKALGV